MPVEPSRCSLEPPRSHDDSQLALSQVLAESITPEKIDHWAEVISHTLDRFPDATLLTVLDEGYPENLRKVFDHPPFIFVRGKLLDEDARSVAVVGTRQASPEGRQRAYELASQLATRGVTVISGLAAGIDTSAHTGSLDAGGRTIAVMGTGIDRIYPRQNAQLAERIPHQGALVSQLLAWRAAYSPQTFLSATSSRAASLSEPLSSRQVPPAVRRCKLDSRRNTASEHF